MPLSAHPEKTSARSQWLIASAIAALAIAMGFVVWICIGMLQENSVQMQRYQVKPQAEIIDTNGLTEKLVFPHRSREIGDKQPHHDSIKLVEQAQVLVDVHDFAKALPYYDRAIKTFAAEVAASKPDPDDNRALSITYQRRGKCHLWLKQYPLAVEDFTRAIQLRPGSESDYRRRAKAYRGMGKRDLAKLDDEMASQIKSHPVKGHTQELFEDMYGSPKP